VSLSESQLVRIIAIDPGVTTGIAEHEVFEGRVNPEWDRRMMGPEKHHKELYNYLINRQPHVIVCERFEYRIIRNRGADMPGIYLESREYIGVCELYSQVYNVPLVMQPTSCKGDKALISPNKLKGLGLYRAPSGAQHMNDATAHGLHYVVTVLGRRDYLLSLNPNKD